MLPQAFITSLQGIEGFDQEAFERVHQSGEQVTSIRNNPLKGSDIEIFSTIPQKVPWCQYGYYLDKRPSFTFDPLFHAGSYYVQEASSMFLEQAIIQNIDNSQPVKVLDLCAAPGGKSTHLQSLISPDSLLVSNEVIKARAGVLRQNIVKWGGGNVIITNNDPQHFSRLKGFFDVMVVDAPCSGSGLFRRDEMAIQEWSLDNVQLCCGRQQRILSDALPALKQDGLLVYSTCSYSKEEDEDIMDWLVKVCDMDPVALQIHDEWNIVETKSFQGSIGYRFYPDKIKGEGFFLACFKKKGGEESGKVKMSKPEKASVKEKQVLTSWVDLQAQEVLKFNNTLFALPTVLLDAFSAIQSNLYIQYAGVTLGEIMRDKLVPDHALALSALVKDRIPRTELTYEDAIKYLQRADISSLPEIKGWQLVTYKNKPLGWVNALSNRINNYYPKELRILKQHNDSSFEKI